MAPPVVVFAVRFNGFPEQTGELLPAMGMTGVSFITGVVVPAADVQPLMVTVTEYVPAAASVTFVMDGVWLVLVNPLGPLHDQVAVPGEVVLALSASVLPLHMGELLPATGVAGGVGSTSVTGPTVLEIQPFKVTVRLA